MIFFAFCDTVLCGMFGFCSLTHQLVRVVFSSQTWLGRRGRRGLYIDCEALLKGLVLR